MGWSYPHWIGNFYPTETKSEEFLREYSKRFDTVEVYNTFYRIPSTRVVEDWKNKTGESFIFSAKFPKSVTHVGLLGEASEKLAIFLKHISVLNEKLGPLLMQFPPSFGTDEISHLKDFLAGLPKDHKFALEIRDKRWLGEELYSLLRDRNVALALVEAPWMFLEDVVTSDFVYIRWEGNRRKIHGDLGRVEVDRSVDLARWVVRIKGFLKNSIEVFGYFSKYYSGHPPTDVGYLLNHSL